MQFTRVVLAASVALVPVAPAAAHGSHPGAADRLLIPSAGWHGRPIKNPHHHKTVRSSAAEPSLRGWSAGPVSSGAGYHRPGGSDRVREVQRRLRRLGYHTGPLDGLFGPLTRASVGWFQVKHGLPVDGRATLATVRHLRAGSGGSHARAERPKTPLVTARPDTRSAERATAPPAISRPETGSAERATTPPAISRPETGSAERASTPLVPRPETESAERASTPFAWIVASALALLAGAAVRRWRRPTPVPPAVAEPHARALAYVLIPAGEPDDARFRSHAEAIETECAARGLAVVGLVADVEDSRLIWQRPGLATAVRRLVDGEVDFLMVTRIEDASGADLKRLVEATQGEIAIARWQHESRVASRDERELSHA